MTMIGPPSIGTSFPGSPSNGDLAILVDSTTNPTYQFLFRYNSGSSSAYKWESLGGAGALEGTTTITVPRAGDWMVEIGGGGQNLGANAAASITINAGGITLLAEGGGTGGGTQTNNFSFYDKGRMTGLTASQALTPTQSSMSRPYIRATPIRLS